MDHTRLTFLACLLSAMGATAQDGAETDQPELEAGDRVSVIQPGEPEEIEEPLVDPRRMMQPSWSLRSRSSATLEADIEGAGGYSRWSTGAELDVQVPIDERTSMSFGVMSGITDYDFSGNSSLSLGSASDPWNTIASHGLSIGFRKQIGDREGVFGKLNIASDGESGADFGDTLTGGVIGGYTYTYSENLTLGVGAIIQTRLEDSVLVIPIPVVNWRPPIGEDRRWSVGTGGAGGGPSNAAGFLIGYEASKTLTFNAGIGLAGIAGDFRLDDDGLAPGGVGKDTSFPVIAGVDWKPTPNVRVGGYVGATFFHEIELLNSSGDTLAKRDVDPSPVVGVSVSIRF